MKIKLSWFSALAAIVVALPLLSAPAASAAGVVLTRFHGYGENRCLDGYGLGRTAHTNPCTDSNFQLFYWNNTPGVQTPIKSYGEDLLGKDLCLAAEGTEVRFRQCNDGAQAQRWKVIYPAGGTVPFIRSTVGDPTKCLTRAADKIVLKVCEEGNNYHRWVPDRAA